jgi:hypothetical protein
MTSRSPEASDGLSDNMTGMGPLLLSAESRERSNDKLVLPCESGALHSFARVDVVWCVKSLSLLVRFLHEDLLCA